MFDKSIRVSYWKFCLEQGCQLTPILRFLLRFLTWLPPTPISQFYPDFWDLKKMSCLWRVFIVSGVYVTQTSVYWANLRACCKPMTPMGQSLFPFCLTQDKMAVNHSKGYDRTPRRKPYQDQKLRADEYLKVLSVMDPSMSGAYMRIATRLPAIRITE